jgi:hypothetical protein
VTARYLFDKKHISTIRCRSVDVESVQGGEEGGPHRRGKNEGLGRATIILPHKHFELAHAHMHCTHAPPSVSCSWSPTPSCSAECPSCPCCWILAPRAVRRARVYSAAFCTTSDPSSGAFDFAPPTVVAPYWPAAASYSTDAVLAHCEPDKVVVFSGPPAAADASSCWVSSFFLNSGWPKSVDAVTTRGASILSDNAALAPGGALAGARAGGALSCIACRASKACRIFHVSASVTTHIRRAANGDPTFDYACTFHCGSINADTMALLLQIN